MNQDYDIEQAQMIADVKFGLNLLVVVFKNYALYPESNNIRRSSLEKFYQWLSQFLSDHESLFLLVGKDSLFFQGEAVLRDKPEEPALIFPLFRDGVQWIEFVEGLTAGELESFVILLGRFRILKEEAEDDLVTAMWEAAFTSINYKTADEFWDLDPLIDISNLQVMREESPEGAWGSGGSFGGGAGGGGVGSGDYSGIGGGTGGGVGAGVAAGTAIGAEGAQTADKPGLGSQGQSQNQGREQGGSEGLGSLGGGGRGDGKVITLSAHALRGEADQLTLNLGAAKAKPISALFAFADGTEDDAPLPAGQAAGPAGGGAVMAGADDAARTQEAIKLAAGLASGRRDFFKFSREEKEALKTLIAIEETRNSTKDSLEVILVVLKNLRGAVDRTPILDFVVEEMCLVLSQGKIYQIRVFIEKVKALAAAGDPWMGELAESLMARTAVPEVLEALKPVWRIKNPAEAALTELKRFLLLLAPEAVRHLTPVLAPAIDPRLEEALLDVIAVKLIQLGGNPLELVRKMKAASIVGLVGRFHGPTPPIPTSLLLGLTKHEAPVVREAAAQAILNDHPDNIRYLFHLIDDPADGLSRWLCHQLGRRRNPLAEKLLFDYLEDAYLEGREQNRERLLDCYRALGQCASPDVIPFLEEILMKRAWRSFFGLEASPHRLGAAMALILLPGEWGAGAVLKKAAQSPFRALRQVVQTAEEELGVARRPD